MFGLLPCPKSIVSASYLCHISEETDPETWLLWSGNVPRNINSFRCKVFLQMYLYIFRVHSPLMQTSYNVFKLRMIDLERILYHDIVVFPNSLYSRRGLSSGCINNARVCFSTNFW